MSTPWQTLSREALTEKVRQIVKQTDSDDQFRDRVVSELGYSYSKEGIAVTSIRNDQGTMVMAMLHHPEGTVRI